MSADNYIAIRKEGRKYRGYTQFASCDEERFDGSPIIEDTTLRGIIKKAQAEYTEYGYTIDI